MEEEITTPGTIPTTDTSVPTPGSTSIPTPGTSVPTPTVTTPVPTVTTPKSTKRAREKEENKLLEEALGVMRTAVNRDVAAKDSDTVFGEYVAGELREMDVNLKRHVKFRIQTVLYEAHSQYSQPAYPY